jgi:dolichyl-phosphate-mannose-protein mannosyltransferase
MKDKKNLLSAGIIAVISAVTHFAYFGYPLSVVFDETYFLKFVGQYWEGLYFFDVHPPVGKLIFVFFAWITGITPTSQIGAIHTAIDPSLVYFRLIPIIAGTVLPIVIYFICRRLNLSYVTAFLAGLFICFENSLVVQSRFVLIDPLLILTGFLALLWYLDYRSHRTRIVLGKVFLFLSALAFACTVSIKWNGLFFAAPIFAFELYDIWKDRILFWRASGRFLLHTLLYFIIGIILYTSFFAIHFSLLTKSGPGDAFMSHAFQKTLEGSKYADNPSLVPPKFFGKLFELNGEMYDSHTRMTKEHNYASQFYTWPSMQRPIYYWHEEASSTPTTPRTDGRIYLIGNPLLYWFGTAAIVCMLLYGVTALIRRKTSELHNPEALWFIVIAYLGNFLPYILITRVMFLYHYQAALVVSLMAIAYLFEMIAGKKTRLITALVFVVACISLFLYFAPLTYGTFLTEKAYEHRVWFKSWK